MLRVALEFIQPGMKVARPIYDSRGRLLLGVGTELTAAYVRRLSEMNIAAVYITDDMFEELDEVPDVVSRQNRLEAIKSVKSVYQDLEKNRRIDVNAVSKAVDNLLDEILDNRNIMINCFDIMTYDDYTFNHSVGVCILSVMTGIVLGYNHLQLKELGIGAILHDVGKIKIEKAILNKPGKLTEEEYEKIKCHAEHGFEILRRYHGISTLSAHIAFQHHERWNGEGYPRSLAGKQIHEYSRIVAVADVFDALTTERPYSKAVPVLEAMSYIKSTSNVLFEENAAEALMSNVAPYPLGSIVKLNTGHIGQVVNVSRNAPFQPVVRVMFSENYRRLFASYEIDLSKMDDLYITQLLSEKEVVELMNFS